MRKKVDIKHNLDSWNKPSVAIEDIEKDLDDLKEEGATHLELIYSEEDGTLCVYPHYYRPLTDEEEAKRQEEIKKWKQTKKEKELAQLKKLKEKYES